jgi:hypothetical protein
MNAKWSYSTPQMMELLWEDIWNVKGSRAVKNFLWQACNNILLTKEQLFKRHITLDALVAFVVWKLKHHDIFYIGKRCVVGMCSSIQISTSDVADFFHIIEILMARLDADHMQLVATVARSLVEEECSYFLDPTSLIRRATEQVDLCNKVGQRSVVSDMIPRSSPVIVWEKPCQG